VAPPGAGGGLGGCAGRDAQRCAAARQPRPGGQQRRMSRAGQGRRRTPAGAACWLCDCWVTRAGLAWRASPVPALRGGAEPGAPIACCAAARACQAHQPKDGAGGRASVECQESSTKGILVRAPQPSACPAQHPRAPPVTHAQPLPAGLVVGGPAPVAGPATAASTPAAPPRCAMLLTRLLPPAVSCRPAALPCPAHLPALHSTHVHAPAMPLSQRPMGARASVGMPPPPAGLRPAVPTPSWQQASRHATLRAPGPLPHLHSMPAAPGVRARAERGRPAPQPPETPLTAPPAAPLPAPPAAGAWPA